MPFSPELRAKIDAARSAFAPQGDDELSVLRRKLAAREGRPEYADSVNKIRARIAELEAAGAVQGESNV